ncbi:MAG: right-handed parallel beta-helix repeat-containing protein [Armatimonadia bacterium]
MRTFGLTLTLTLLVASAASAAGVPLILYVAPSGNDGWSGRLAAPNAARTDGPLASVAGARDVLRKAKPATPMEVRVRGGRYEVSSPVVFEPQDSGTTDCPISYVAYPGEKPVLSGGVRVTGFKPYRGKVVCADLPQARDGGWVFRSLFVDGERAIRARYPNYDPSDPYRKGFLYVRPDCFGEAVGAAHNAGDWLQWQAEIPAAGQYAVWALYGHGMKQLNREDMAGQTSLAVDGGEKTVLQNLPDTGGWRDFKWAKTAEMALPAGKHTLRWSNDKGGGINFDAFVLTDDPAWMPSSWRLPPVAAGKHLVIIQAEEYTASQGLQIVKCGGLSSSSKTVFPFAAGTMKASWAAEPDAEVHVWPSSPNSCRAFNEIVKLDKVDTEQGTATVSGKQAATEICSGDRYFVENVLEELDSPGEWYLDTRAGKLYLWPKKPLTAASQVVAPRATQFFVFKGEQGKPVHHLRLSGLTLQESDFTNDDGFVMYGHSLDGVITLQNADDIAVEDCTLRNIGKAGIYASFGSNNRFVGNEISYCAAGGITASNSPAGMVISDNHIHHLGWVYKHVAGISTGDQVHGALIAHNHIHDTSRWGISVGHTTSTKNIVEYNHLHHLNTETYDTGGLEVTQQSRDHRSGSIFRYNLIHDTGGYSSMMGKDLWNSWGIYLDSFAGGFTVYGNVVYRAQDGGLMVQGGKDNKVFNNVFVDNGPRRQILIANFMNNSTGTEFTRNIVSYSDPKSMLIYGGRQFKDSIARWDDNVYYQSGAGEVKCYVPGDEPYAEWFRPLDFWRKLGFDKNSVVADPQFVDPAKDDFRLKPTSPAFRLGFEKIDLSTVGPRKRR